MVSLDVSMQVARKTIVLFIAVLAVCLGAIHIPRCVIAADVDVENNIKLLDSKDSLDAGEAARTLGDCKNAGEAVIQALVDHLGDEREGQDIGPNAPMDAPPVGDFAMWSLVRIDKPTVVPPLCTLLKNSGNDGARIRALKTLTRLGRTAHDSIGQLKVNAQDKNRDIRYLAIEAMVAVSADPAEIIPMLQNALLDKDSGVKSAAVLGLGGFGPKAQVALPQLLPLLESSELRGIAYSSDMRGWVPLRIDVAMTLGKIGPSAKAALPVLEKMIHDEDCHIRVAAAFAQCQISNQRAPGLDVLFEELNNKFAASDAVLALGQIGNKHFVKPVLEGLKNALKHPDDLVRHYAVESIGKISPPDIVNILRPLTKDSSSLVQDSVFSILHKCAENDEDQCVKDAAKEVLQKIQKAKKLPIIDACQQQHR